MKVESALPLGKVDPGLRSVPKLDLATVGTAARELEELGFDGMVSGETKTDPFIPLALAATTTTRLSLTTAVAIAFPRSPMVTALVAWDLQTLSKGRFILGLGTQVKGHNERRYSVAWAPPMPRLREYIRAVRAIWDCWQNGTKLNVRGEHYNFSLMVPLFNPGPIEHPDIPIHIAAVNTGMCHLAGEMCDGLRPHPITTQRYIEEVMLPAVRDGSRKTGRDVKDVEIVVSPLIAAAATSAGLADRIKDVRARISFYASTRTYHPVFELHGWGALARELHELSIAQRWDEMPRRITDEMLETIAIVGTFDTLADKIKRRYGGFSTRIEFGLPVHSAEDYATLRGIVRQIQG
jgi:probable F420-dependent oxidoreductase